MIQQATPTTIGGIKLAGALAGGTASLPTIPAGYVTPAMLSQAYATAAALTTETNRAIAAENTITTGYEQAVDDEIAARIAAIAEESTTRANTDAALQSEINTINAELASGGGGTWQAAVAVLNTNLSNETAARETADATQTTNIATNASNISAEITRATAAETAKLAKASNLSDVTSVAAARTNLGLGSAATHPSTDFDAAGAAATVQTNLTSEITRAEAAEATFLVKTNNLSDIGNAATARTNLGLGSAATHATTDFDAAGTSAAETTRAQAAEATKATDTLVVHLAGTETITGNKNFTGTVSHNSNALVDTTDSRLSDQRVPTNGSVTDAKISASGLTNAAIATAAAIARTKLDSSTQTSLGKADTAVQSVNGKTGTSVTLGPVDVSAIPDALVTTKGDLIAASSSGNPNRLAVGTDNQSLIADSSQTLGVRWAFIDDAQIDPSGLTNASIATTAAIARTKLDSSTQTSLGLADTAVQSVNGHIGSTVTLTLSDFGLGGGWVSKSANYTLLNTDAGVTVTATATITLPTSPIPGKRYGVKNFAPGVVVTVSTGGSAVIDSGGTINATSTQITSQGVSLDFTQAPNGVDWLIV